MLIIPHSTALDLEGHAYTTYAVAILCIVIFYFQYTNEASVDSAIFDYCTSVYSDELPDDSIDIMRSDIVTCYSFINIYHTHVEFLIPGRIESEDFFGLYHYSAQMDEMLKLTQAHYDAFNKDAPASLNAKIMYYPDSWNPFTMISSTLSHGDFEHIFFNLIFFLAFAPALELLIGNTLKYLGIMLAISVVTSISYSLAYLLGGGTPIPSLGLSGLVMGMIGMSAFLMPKAKIRVFVWLFTFARNFYISAWILAAWYIGWDTWELLNYGNYGGVNLVAHVSGGFAGYFIARRWLKETREETRDDVDDEIEYQRSKRADKYTSHNISYSGNRRYTENKQQERQFKKDYDGYMSRLHQCVSVRNDSEAIILLLENYDLYSTQPEIYEEEFQRVSEWGDSRTLLCLGRTCISLLLERKLYKRIIPILAKCQSVSKEFVLANPDEVLLLAHPLIDLQEYKMAHYLIHNAERRYGEYIDFTLCKLLEAKLLWQYLEQEEEARQLVNALLANSNKNYKAEILTLAKALAT